MHLVKAMVFPVVMYGYECWNIKKAECWRIDAFELWCWRRLLRVPWTARRSNPSNPKGNQSWIFIGKTDAGAETPILWPPEVKNWLIGKYPDVGKDWRWEEKGMTEEKMPAPWKENYDKLIEYIKKQRHHFANKCPWSKLWFSNSHIWMWELEHK